MFTIFFLNFNLSILVLKLGRSRRNYYLRRKKVIPYVIRQTNESDSVGFEKDIPRLELSGLKCRPHGENFFDSNQTRKRFL